MSWSYLPIPTPKVGTKKFNEIKPPEVSTILKDTVLVRFFEYCKKKCGIEQLEKWQLKTFLNLVKEITENWIWHQYKSCTWQFIDFTKPDEYVALMWKYKDTESFLEFYLWWWTSRVFWFFLWADNEIPPTFNIVLITWESHLDYKKRRK